jgi:LysR family transcriptional regulator, mexEF-oprN operon transcriptional activator
MDLNLLAYFDALISEGQVSRAAERVNLSQPAMSLALKRLRELFDDPLLVRTSSGMVPTSRARELIGPVREILRRSGDLLRPRGNFVPAEASGSLVLMSTDYVSMLLMPPLMRQIESIAPGVRINAKAVEPEQLKYLFESGQVDLGVGYAVNPPGELRIRQAFEENLVCIARAGHPTIQGRVTLEQFTANPHVQIRPGDMRYAVLLERALSFHGVEAAVGAIVHDFLLAPEIVASTNMIAVVPERMARRYARSLDMQTLPLPVDVPPLNFSMIWHERTHREPLYQWLRDLVLQICVAL